MNHLGIAQSPSGHREATVRRPARDPELLLLDGVLDLALQRVTFVLEFARHWDTLRRAGDYQAQRAKCHFHLQWIFDDEPTECFTFREICRFSRSPLLRDLEPARDRIRRAFSLEAARDVARPLSRRQYKHVESDWLADVHPISLVARDSFAGACVD